MAILSVFFFPIFDHSVLLSLHEHFTDEGIHGSTLHVVHLEMRVENQLDAMLETDIVVWLAYERENRINCHYGY